jgi:phosphohistidine phosphatase SixA
MFQAILIRLGERTHRNPDREDPLTAKGREAAERLGDYCNSVGIRPSLVIASDFAHARETAELIRSKVDPSAPIIVARSLEPHGDDLSIEAILQQAESQGQALPEQGIVLLVGHEPRLTQLATMMSTKRFPPLGRLGPLCLEADNLSALRLGRAHFRWRFNSPEPPSHPRPSPAASTDALKEKLVGKTTVAALLAGFTFTALLELVKDREGLKFMGHIDSNAILEGLPIIFLSVSFVGFLAAVYIYDRLSMPENFLESNPTRSILLEYLGKCAPTLVTTYLAREERFGFVYAAMIHSWQWVFTPAVCFGLLGFLCIVARASFELSLILAAVIALIAVYYKIARPQYSVD